MATLCSSGRTAIVRPFFLRRTKLNQGKRFESALKKSVPDYALLYRLPDPAQSFGGGSNTRFSRHNPFDFIIFSPKTRTLYAIEAKTVKGKSISFERCKEDHGEIHHYQISGLNEWNAYDGIICGFIIEFRELEKTVFINIEDFNNLIDTIDKKSFNFGDLEKLGLPFYTIEQNKKRTQYTYNIDGFLNSIYFEEKEKN